MSGNATNTHEPPPLASIVASACFVGLVMILTIVGNSLVCFSVFYFRRLRSPTYYLIVSLAVSDLLIGFLSLPFRLSQTANGEVWPQILGYQGCRFWIWIDFFCCGASILNLTVISIDRLFGIQNPLQYRERMTTKRACLMIVFAWVYALILASLSFVKWKGPEKETVVINPQCSIITKVYITIAAFTAFFFPLVVLVCCYSVVLRIAYVHARRIQKEKTSVHANFQPAVAVQESLTGSDENVLSPTASSKAISIFKCSKENLDGKTKNRAQSGLQLMKQLKATKTLAIVVGIFILCWLPFFVIYLIFQYCRHACFHPSRISTDTETAIKVVFIYVLPVSNSAANPIIYICLDREFRSAVVQLVLKLLRKSHCTDNKGFDHMQRQANIELT